VKPNQITLLSAIVLATLASNAGAQNYSIDWSTIDGGGGTSTGGVYSGSGTIGQHDAGAMSGGSYSVVGGFWGLIAAIQTPGAPLLRIVNTGTNAVAVVWPSTPAIFTLQQNTDLNTTNWVSVGVVPNDDGTNKSVIISPAAGNHYFRLKWP
jgi:hypothetical protein